MLPYIDYDYLKEHPKVIVGHSDITSLLLAINEKCGFPTFYGPNFVTSFAHKKYYQDCALNSFLNIINHSESYTILKPEYYTDESTDWYATEKAFNKNLENEISTSRSYSEQWHLTFYHKPILKSRFQICSFCFC